MHRPAAPLAALGLLLSVLAIAALARPRAEPAPPPPDPPTQAPPSEQGRRLLSEEPVDLNRADAEELELLPHIGPTLARRIVDDRAARGPYARPADLARVRGIGPRTLETLGPLVTTSP